MKSTKLKCVLDETLRFYVFCLASSDQSSLIAGAEFIHSSKEFYNFLGVNPLVLHVLFLKKSIFSHSDCMRRNIQRKWVSSEDRLT